MFIVKTSFGNAHALIYEKDKLGYTTIVDCQNNKVYDVDKSYKTLDKMFLPERYLDFSDTSLNNNNKKLLDKLVEQKVNS